MMYYSSQNIILDAVVMFQKVTNPCVDTQFTGARIINIFRILSGVQLYKLVQFTVECLFNVRKFAGKATTFSEPALCAFTEVAT